MSEEHSGTAYPAPKGGTGRESLKQGEGATVDVSGMDLKHISREELELERSQNLAEQIRLNDALQAAQVREAYLGQDVRKVERALYRLWMRWEDEVEDTAAVAIITDCGIDADALKAKWAALEP